MLDLPTSLFPTKKPWASFPTCLRGGRESRSVLFVGEEYEHVTIARIQSRIVFGNRHSLAELTRHAPSPGDAVAEAIDESVHYIGVIEASVVRAVDGPELVDTALLVRG